MNHHVTNCNCIVRLYSEWYRAIQATPAPHSTLFLLPKITHILEWLECYMDH